jgi:hypothetical protein
MADQTKNGSDNVQEQISGINNRLDNLDGEIGKLKRKEKSRCRKNLLCNYWFLWGIIIILLGMIIFCLVPRMDIKDNYTGAVLGFVGILATFTVMGNYAQVVEIKREFKKKIEESEQYLTKGIQQQKQDLENKVMLSLNGALFIFNMEAASVYMQQGTFNPNVALNYLSNAAGHLPEIKTPNNVKRFISDANSVINYLDKIFPQNIDWFCKCLQRISTIEGIIDLLFTLKTKESELRQRDSVASDATTSTDM